MANFAGLPTGQPVSTTGRSTTQELPLGTRAYDASGNEWTYIKAGAAIAQYDSVRFQGSALGFDDVRPVSAVNQYVIGVASAAFDSAAYGFVQTRGIATTKVITSTAVGSLLVSSGTVAGCLKLATEAESLAGAKPAVCLATGAQTGSAVYIG